jgi:very-short-patch-repair endonuclease
MRHAARVLRRLSTPSEEALWAEVRNRRLNGYRFRRQQPIGPYIVDFYCSTARLIVEIDGPVHGTQLEYDVDRQRELEVAGYRFLRVAADRVLGDLPGVLQEIGTTLAAAPPLPRQGEGAGG